MATRDEKKASRQLSEDDLREFLRAIEMDDVFIEGLRALVGHHREWFFKAAGTRPGFSSDERGHAAYIFGRLSSTADLPKLAKLAVHASPLVRGNVIEAIGQLADPEATALLLKLVADSTRPLVDRLQAARMLGADVTDATRKGLRKLDLNTLPDELHLGIKAILEARFRRGRYPGKAD